MSKQDRTVARTPSDLERKYNFGGEKVKRQEQDVHIGQLAQDFDKFQELVSGKIKSLEEKLSRYAYYPVGSIHISIVNENPGKVFGGEWILYMEGYLVIASELETEETESELLRAQDRCYVWKRIK